MSKSRLLLAASAAILAGMTMMPSSMADPVKQTLYFTTFNGGGMDVWKTTATYSGNGTAGNGTFTPGAATNLASTPGADGIVLNPNNNQLLVGGQNTGNIYQVSPGGGNVFTTMPSGMTTYEITVDPNKNVVWGGGSENDAHTITSVPINPAGAPTTVSVTGSDNTITHITFVPGMAAGTAFYTSSGDSGGGDIGTINLSTGVTTALLKNVQYSHGMVYDPFTGDLIISGGDEIAQINPTTDALVSLVTLRGDNLDQGSVDGKGHLYWADNGGNLVFIDYSNTGLIGSSSDFVSNAFYMSQLDDLAPLIGSGGTNNIPEPASLLLFGGALAGFNVLRRRQRKTS